MKPAPCAQPLRQALDDNAALTRLMQRVRESRERFTAIQPCLPAALGASLQAGPLDETGWTLLAANAAVAAKLRHLLPSLSKRLSSLGYAEVPLRVKIQAPQR